MSSIPMVDEIQQAISYLSAYLYGKIPRRKVKLFGEQLANLLVLKFTGYWNAQCPADGADYRCLHINKKNCAIDSILTTAASSIALEVDEVLKALPVELDLWINPNQVLCRQGDSEILCPVVNIVGRNTFKCRPVSAVDCELPNFQISSPHDAKFTSDAFSKTRFGSTKMKTMPSKHRLDLTASPRCSLVDEGQLTNQRPAVPASFFDDLRHPRGRAIVGIKHH